MGFGFGLGAGSRPFRGGGFNALALPGSSGTGLVWIDAHPDYHVESGGSISAVTNRAGGSAILTIDAGDEPGFTAANSSYGGGPTIDIASGDGIKLTNHGITTNAITLIMVCHGTDAFWFYDANGVLFANAGGGSGDKLQISNDGGTYLVGDIAKSGVPGVYIFVFNGTSSKIYESKRTPKTGSAGTPGSAGATIGLASSYDTTGVGLGGSFRHLLLFTGALSQSDCEYELTGLGAESGLTIGA